MNYDNIFISDNGRKFTFSFSKNSLEGEDVPENTVMSLHIGITEHSGFYVPIVKNQNENRYIDWGCFSGVAFRSLPQDLISHMNKVLNLLVFL
jgi:hypothetical protein